jgi:hypothetical protein
MIPLILLIVSLILIVTAIFFGVFLPQRKAWVSSLIALASNIMVLIYCILRYRTGGVIIVTSVTAGMLVFLTCVSFYLDKRQGKKEAGITKNI